ASRRLLRDRLQQRIRENNSKDRQNHNEVDEDLNAHLTMSSTTQSKKNAGHSNRFRYSKETIKTIRDSVRLYKDSDKRRDSRTLANLSMIHNKQRPSSDTNYRMSNNATAHVLDSIISQSEKENDDHSQKTPSPAIVLSRKVSTTPFAPHYHIRIPSDALFPQRDYSGDKSFPRYRTPANHLSRMQNLCDDIFPERNSPDLGTIQIIAAHQAADMNMLWKTLESFKPSLSHCIQGFQFVAATIDAIRKIFSEWREKLTANSDVHHHNKATPHAPPLFSNGPTNKVNVMRNMQALANTLHFILKTHEKLWLSSIGRMAFDCDKLHRSRALIETLEEKYNDAEILLMDAYCKVNNVRAKTVARNNYPHDLFSHMDNAILHGSENPILREDHTMPAAQHSNLYMVFLSELDPNSVEAFKLMPGRKHKERKPQYPEIVNDGNNTTISESVIANQREH
ncbi:hypothetical protein KDA14_01235, partial [Candidatus Saccharibacteria bacterium]|nr:hypothetical protein [Candidatus Saccharibacteria bacterium]